jgi:antitoxin YefM
MYSFNATELSARLPEMLELADIDEIVLTREEGENLVIVKESVWRGIQEIAHLFATDVNAGRLLTSLQQLRSEFLSQAEVEG